MKKKSIIWSLSIFLGLVVLAVYAYLGGFNPVAVSIQTNNQYTIIGNYYIGAYDRDSLQMLFFEAKEHLEKSKKDGILSIVNYRSGEESDSVEMFVGILSKSNNGHPAHWETIHLQAEKAIRAKISAHNLVMPTRPSIATKIQTFADKNNLTLQPILIEKYISENQLEIDHLTE